MSSTTPRRVPRGWLDDEQREHMGRLADYLRRLDDRAERFERRERQRDRREQGRRPWQTFGQW